jgi:hypothetical protein
LLIVEEKRFHNRSSNLVSTSSLIGVAGEHYVLSELLRRGYIASLAPQGVPTMDVVVADTNGAELCAIQVKSRQHKGRDRGWHMRRKHETMLGARLFYAFVDFGETHLYRPNVYVLPSEKVAEVLSVTHAAWLANPGQHGQQRKDTELRRLLPDYEYAFRPGPNTYPEGWLQPYLNAWHLLELPETDEFRFP